MGRGGGQSAAPGSARGVAELGGDTSTQQLLVLLVAALTLSSELPTAPVNLGWKERSLPPRYT